MLSNFKYKTKKPNFKSKSLNFGVDFRALWRWLNKLINNNEEEKTKHKRYLTINLILLLLFFSSFISFFLDSFIEGSGHAYNNR